MKLGVMQPYFFPYFPYFQLINAVDKYIVYDDVSYIKGGWINRNNILVNDKKTLITLPLEGSSSFRNINEIEITKNEKMKNKIIKSIKLAYAKAPNFSEVMPFIEDLILTNTNISTLNYKIILEINEYLEIKTEIILSSKMDKNTDEHSEAKIIYLNKLVGADSYINAMGGIELYHKEIFEKEGIKLNFLKPKEFVYKQFGNEFVPNLSIIDVLMFNPKEKIQDLLGEFDLV